MRSRTVCYEMRYGALKRGDGFAVDAVVNLPVRAGLPNYLYICEQGENKIRRAKLFYLGE